MSVLKTKDRERQHTLTKCAAAVTGAKPRKKKKCNKGTVADQGENLGMLRASVGAKEVGLATRPTLGCRG